MKEDMWVEDQGQRFKTSKGWYQDQAESARHAVKKCKTRKQDKLEFFLRRLGWKI